MGSVSIAIFICGQNGNIDKNHKAASGNVFAQIILYHSLYVLRMKMIGQHRSR